MYTLYIIMYTYAMCQFWHFAMLKSLSPTGQAEQVRRGVGGSLVATNGNTTPNIGYQVRYENMWTNMGESKNYNHENWVSSKTCTEYTI